MHFSFLDAFCREGSAFESFPVSERRKALSACRQSEHRADVASILAKVGEMRARPRLSGCDAKCVDKRVSAWPARKKKRSQSEPTLQACLQNVAVMQAMDETYERGYDHESEKICSR